MKFLSRKSVIEDFYSLHLESSARLAPHGLLDESELEGPRAHLKSLSDELARVSSYLQTPIIGREAVPSPDVGNPASE